MCKFVCPQSEASSCMGILRKFCCSCKPLTGVAPSPPYAMFYIFPQAVWLLACCGFTKQGLEPPALHPDSCCLSNFAGVFILLSAPIPSSGLPHLSLLFHAYYIPCYAFCPSCVAPPPCAVFEAWLVSILPAVILSR